jgi:hypothetical protein
MATALASVLSGPREPRRLLADVVAACARSPPTAVPRGGLRRGGAGGADHPADLGVVALAADAAPDPAAGPGRVHAGRRPARLPARHRHRTARQLRQRGPLGPDGKHVDVPELLQLRRSRVPGAGPRARVLPDGITWFATPAPEFRLHRDRAHRAPLALPGAPAPASCSASAAPAPCAPHPARTSSRGDSCFIPFADGPVPPPPPASPRHPALTHLAHPRRARVSMITVVIVTATLTRERKLLAAQQWCGASKLPGYDDERLCCRRWESALRL